MRVVLRRCYGLFCFFRYLSAIPTCCRENRRTEKTNTSIMKTIHNVWEDVMNG